MSPGKAHAEDSARVRATSEGLYRAIFHQQADGVFLADEEGRFLEVNQHFCQMLGWRPRELLSLAIQDLLPIPDLALDPLGLDELRSDGTLHKERRLRCRDGTLQPECPVPYMSGYTRNVIAHHNTVDEGITSCRNHSRSIP